MSVHWWERDCSYGRKNVVHRVAAADDKKLQFSLKTLGVNNMSGIEDVNILQTKEELPALTPLKFRPLGQ